MPLTQIPADSLAKTMDFSQKLAELSNMSFDELLKKSTTWCIEIVFKIVLAIIIYQIGRWVIHRLKKMVIKAMERKGVETTLKNFLSSLLHSILITLLIGAIIVILGVSTTSIVAILASASLGLGIAMSGTLQNFAGGVMVLLQKPYKIGDFIEVDNQTGKVQDIRLFHTVINTLENKQIYLPNGSTASGVIINYTAEVFRRVEWVISVSYGEDVNNVKEVLREILDQEERLVVEEDKPIMIVLKALSESSVDIMIRAWAKTDEQWDVYFDINQKIYDTFNEKGISFPFPQLDVLLKQQ